MLCRTYAEALLVTRKKVHSERGYFGPVYLGEADFQQYLLLPARLGDANRVDDLFGERHGHFGNLIGDGHGCCRSGQHDPVLLCFNLNLFAGKAASNRFAQQGNVHIPKDFENARFVVFLPEHHAAAAGCNCGDN